MKIQEPWLPPQSVWKLKNTACLIPFVSVAGAMEEEMVAYHAQLPTTYCLPLPHCSLKEWRQSKTQYMTTPSKKSWLWVNIWTCTTKLYLTSQKAENSPIDSVVSLMTYPDLIACLHFYLVYVVTYFFNVFTKVALTCSVNLCTTQCINVSFVFCYIFHWTVVLSVLFDCFRDLEKSCWFTFSTPWIIL